MLPLGQSRGVPPSWLKVTIPRDFELKVTVLQFTVTEYFAEGIRTPTGALCLKMFGLRVSNSRGPFDRLFRCQGDSVARYALNEFSSLDHDGVAVVSENTKGPGDGMRKLRALGSAIMCIQEDVIVGLNPSRCAYFFDIPIKVSFVARLCAL